MDEEAEDVGGREGEVEGETRDDIGGEEGEFVT